MSSTSQFDSARRTASAARALPVGPPRWVRPRYLASEDSLPLLDRFREDFLAPGAEPAQLALVAPRGGGATTALDFLRAAARASAARSPLSLEALLTAPAASLEALRAGAAILFLDTSVTPIAPRAWRMTRTLFSQGIPGHPGSLEVLRSARLVLARPGRAEARAAREGDWPGGLSNPTTLELAPWGSDELLELLGLLGLPEAGGAPTAEGRTRGELFRALQELPTHLLARPRAAAWLVGAALRLPPEAPLDEAHLLGQVLSALSPWSLAALSEVEAGSLGPAQLQRLLCAPPPRVEEAATLFELPRALAHVLRDPAHELVERAAALGYLRPEILALGREHQARDPQRSLVAILLDLGALSPGKLLALSGMVQPEGSGQRIETRAPLALPGLEHRLAARTCARGVSAGLPPERIEPQWFPYLRADLGTQAQRILVEWLRDPSRAFCPPLAEPGERSRPALSLPRDAGAATLLWVSGVTPPLDAKTRPLDLRRARLAGLSFPGVVLKACDLSGADFGQARLEGADLSRAHLAGTRFRNASLEGADLSEAVLIEADLRRASLRGARLGAARLTRTDLAYAALEGVHAPGAWLHGCDLRRARAERSVLSGAHLVECRLAGASLEGANLEDARLLRLDLRRTRLARALLRGANLIRCALADQDLREVEADDLRFYRCELARVDLYGASLRRLSLDGCRLEGVRLRRADLRGAAFLRVRFGAPEGDQPAADLRSADLRGATFLGTDLCGVDLRGARIDDRLRAQARRMGALL